jgi:carboxypeptidase Ss1
MKKGDFMPSALDLARDLEPEMIALRRDLHQHPETAWQEVRTATLVAGYCETLGLQTQCGAARTGVIAVLNADKAGPALALRADMDALPIQEENEIPYRSGVADRGHLCGHDAHVAMLLGAAKLLVRQKERIPFPVWFIFQPAEEAPPGGAELLMAEHRLDGVAEIYGLHVNPLLPVGRLALSPGPFMASMDKFELLIEGRGGHGGMPQLTRDPVLAAAETIVALQSIVSRRVDPLDAAVVSVCMMEAGSVFNAIPSRARLTGTARSLAKPLRDQLPQWIREIADGVAAAHSQTVQLEYAYGTPVLVNPPVNTGKMKSAFRALGGEVRDCRAMMYGEDFAFYLEKIPGCFGFLGAGDGTEMTAQGLHHPRFGICEQALAWGAALHVQLVLDRAADLEANPAP